MWQVYCQLFGAHVAVPDRQGEQDFLTARLSTTPAGNSCILDVFIFQGAGSTGLTDDFTRAR
ncbi:hypothetical protein DPMN_083817 [Dreissena polymorpha]|uniref:Uncharacterized protein n=1 Tax=Dreissena polymorpha TaxID=45954 RepID=A0A9D4BK86_DREPO|nr:hypothetical protein DPMN_083817 [Dreissena polymorpha]